MKTRRDYMNRTRSSPISHSILGERALFVELDGFEASRNGFIHRPGRPAAGEARTRADRLGNSISRSAILLVAIRAPLTREGRLIK